MRPNPSQRDGDSGENHGNEKCHDTEKALEQASDKWDEAVYVCVRACVRACVCMCVCVCGHAGVSVQVWCSTVLCADRREKHMRPHTTMCSVTVE